MCKVGDHKSLIVSSLALDANTLSPRAAWVEDRCSVDTHVHLTSLSFKEAQLLRLLRVDVLDKAIYEGRYTVGENRRETHE
jgi:hypothetical protein